VALEGTLRDFSFADILQLISLQRKTGVLTLKNRGEVVTISFLEGNIVGSSSLSQHPEDRMGLILLKRGEISEAQLDTALKRQEDTLQRLGRILIDQGLVSPDAVRTALSQQILQIVYRVFRWNDGEYHFSQETDIDYDRDLMRPMAADSIIMEGARMTDEWPFIDKRIPDREMVLAQTLPGQEFEVVEEEEDDFDDLGFSFADTPEEAPVEIARGPDNCLTKNQHMVYEIVNGLRSVREIILESPLIEFDTCKALADLLDRGIIREATQEEVARQLSHHLIPDEKDDGLGLGAIPWLAFPFLILFGFSLSVMPHNPANPSFSAGKKVWNGIILQASSWFRMNRLVRLADTEFFLDGFYPEKIEDLGKSLRLLPEDYRDPWGRNYRVSRQASKLMLTGTDAEGRQSPMLMLSHPMAWEGRVQTRAATGPGVRLLLR